MDEYQVRTPSYAISNTFLRGVYLWMSLGLFLTGGVAYYVATSEVILRTLVTNPILIFVLILGELGLVFAISGAISKMSASTATILFMIYSALNGLTLSFIFLVYTSASITKTFMVCGSMFAAISLYGYTTSRDLSSWHSFLFMGLIGVIIASIVNIFFHSSQMEFVISIIGIIVFVGLTAYDTQKLKQLAQTAPSDNSSVLQKGTILGALTLYLDFINLFIFLLQIFGRPRN